MGKGWWETLGKEAKRLCHFKRLFNVHPHRQYTKIRLLRTTIGARSGKFLNGEKDSSRKVATGQRPTLDQRVAIRMAQKEERVAPRAMVGILEMEKVGLDTKAKVEGGEGRAKTLLLRACRRSNRGASVL